LHQNPSLLKIASYFTVILPLAFAITLGIATLYNRCSPVEELTEYPTIITTVHVASTVLPQNPNVTLQRTAKSFADRLAPTVNNPNELKTFENTATYISNLYTALNQYAQTGNINDSITIASGESITVKTMLLSVKGSLFRPVVETIQGFSNPKAEAMVKHLEAIQQWASRLT
jgi:hypothetical protein